MQKLPEHDAHSHEYRFRHKDGTWRWVRDDLVLLRDPDGAPREMVGAWLDITTRKEAERALYESQHVLSTILERTGQGLWFIDNDTVTTDVNPAMCAILGRPREEILGKDIYAFADEENTAIFRRELEKRRRGISEPYEIALSRPDGTLVPCINTPSPLYGHDGKKTGSVGIYTDISARKQFERAIADANAALERRVEERTAELADSERFNRGILDSISSHLAVLDGDGRIVAANAAWRRFADANDLDWQKIGEQANYLEVCERTTGECADDAHAVAAGIRDVIAGRRDDFIPATPPGSSAGSSVVSPGFPPTPRFGWWLRTTTSPPCIGPLKMSPPASEPSRRLRWLRQSEFFARMPREIASTSIRAGRKSPASPRRKRKAMAGL